MVNDTRWYHLLYALLTYFVICWLFLSFVGEDELVEWPRFLYYNLVVISTVGFGDFSPQTHLGQIFVALFQIPFGLILFGALIAKATQFITTLARHRMQGFRDYSNLSGHILLFGWNAKQTPKMIDLILADKKRENRTIVLCVAEDLDHPLPDRELIEFARLPNFTTPAALSQVGIQKADKIIIDGKDDSETFAIVLCVASVASKNTHVVAYFEEPSAADLIRPHCPNVEFATSLEAEILVRSMQDPGASQLQNQLFSTLEGQTLFNVELPLQAEGQTFQDISQQLQAHHALTLGFAEDRLGNGLQLNPDTKTTLKAGQYLYFCSRTTTHSNRAWLVSFSLFFIQLESVSVDINHTNHRM